MGKVLTMSPEMESAPGNDTLRCLINLRKLEAVGQAAETSRVSAQTDHVEMIARDGLRPTGQPAFRREET